MMKSRIKEVTGYVLYTMGKTNLTLDAAISKARAVYPDIPDFGDEKERASYEAIWNACLAAMKVIREA